MKSDGDQPTVASNLANEDGVDAGGGVDVGGDVGGGGGGGVGVAGGGRGDGAQQNGKERRRPFLCGVVEGFYGRPWTTEQRKDLVRPQRRPYSLFLLLLDEVSPVQFGKMRTWGMTSYLYAPKDDFKHRAYWRELYTVEEAEHLQSLVALAEACDVDFYYAISPGLDITYSNSKEVACLKRKLDQVRRPLYSMSYYVL